MSNENFALHSVASGENKPVRYPKHPEPSTCRIFTKLSAPTITYVISPTTTLLNGLHTTVLSMLPRSLHFLTTLFLFSNTIMNHFNSSTSQIIQIHAPIVDELLLQYYVDSNFDSVSFLREYSKTGELT